MYCLQIKWKEEEEEDGEKCGSPQRIKCMAHPKEEKWILGTSIKVYTVLCFRFSFFLSSILISMFTSWEINLPSVFRSSWQQCYIKTICAPCLCFSVHLWLSLSSIPTKARKLELDTRIHNVFLVDILSLKHNTSGIAQILRLNCSTGADSIQIDTSRMHSNDELDAYVWK